MFIVPPAKRVGADLLQFAAPEIAEIFSGRKNFRTAAECGKRDFEKQLGSGRRKRRSSRGFPTNSEKQTSRARRDTFTFFGINCLELFSDPTVCGCYWKSCREFPVVDDVFSFHEKELYPKNSLDENCIEFHFRPDRNNYVELIQTDLALKPKFIMGPGLKITIPTTNKERREETKVDKETAAAAAVEEKQQTPFLLATHVYNILHSDFSNVEVYINISQIYNSNELYARKSYISYKRKGAISEYKGILKCKGMTMKNLLVNSRKRLYLNPSSQGDSNCLADPMASWCMRNWGLISSPILNWYVQV